MDIRSLTPAYAVAPQIEPDDFPAIAAAGFTTVIDNRPCEEVPPSHKAPVMQAQAEAAGLEFVVLPLTHATINPDTAAQQKAVLDAATGPVLAYCASGTRCTIIWAVGHANDMPAEDIIATARAQGYDIEAMRDQLNALGGA